jgi:hypothetical protein
LKILKEEISSFFFSLIIFFVKERKDKKKIEGERERKARLLGNEKNV